MRKKILVTMVVLAVVAALALAFSGAQFQATSTSNWNVIAFGNILASEWSPDPMVSLSNLVPGDTTTATCYIKPKGTVNQDIYIGLRNQVGDADAGFGDKVEVALQVDGTWLWGGAYKDVHDLYTTWQSIKSNAAPDTWITINLQLHVKDSLPSSFMGVTYYFKTFIFAVQLGGTPPTTAPYLYTP